ncbi:MAG: GAF and ANTAR domain-containing protein [Rhodococcus sp. (in: high G+C Gram-positive bacteria)]
MPNRRDDIPEDEPYLAATTALTRTVVGAARVDGAAVSIITDKAGARDLLYSTDSVATRIDELQFTIGEGPCLDAFRANEPRTVLDLADTAATAKWPTFASEVVEELNVHTLLACPITVHGAALGVLELYRTEPAPFSTSQFDAARAIATALGPVLLTDLETNAGNDRAAGYPEPEGRYHFARGDVHAAIGMLAVRLDVPVDDAAAILRAHAYTQARSIASIANDIVHRRTDFEVYD